MPRQHRQSPLEERNKSQRQRGFYRRPHTYDCHMCRKDQPLRKCLKFKRMNVTEKLKIVKKYKYCENCLGHSHLVNRCRNSDRCRQCGGRHHSLLHRHQRLRENKCTVKPSSSQSTSGLSTVTLLPTVVVKIELGDAWANVRGILNPCAESSSIAEFLIERYKIPTEGHGTERWCKIKLRPRFYEDPIVRITVKIDGDLPRKQPKEKIDDRVSSLYANLRLADPHFYKDDDINFVLGADVYPRLIKSSIQPESVGTPMAQDSVLGWVIIGKFGV